MGFGGGVESVPSCVKCFTSDETHKNVGIVKTSVVASITINWAVRVICENLGSGTPVSAQLNHGVSVGNVDMSTKLDDDIGRNFHDQDTLAED